ncbi:3-phytase [Pantoea deleyi]|uniref:Histidine-type phosphatase n=1 Tax=Pantoea deleyi TaxID=470932 RepID=A0A506Q2L7_9GAMM|nr:histidine-type phosphatase [Pantoea deleyi]ORM79506.1 3-phytase [Pantoea deleyi]TPV40353.1 histidine-type phosphatase [Pantoea deleyi]
MTLPALYRCALILTSLWLASPAAQAATYQLEKVVELSRHGVRPPTPGNRKEIEAASEQPWTQWSTADGELTGHGYSAVVNKGRWEGDHYRQLGLLTPGCPEASQVYVRASPLQRTRATGAALTDGAFPGCGVPVHSVAGDADPLFQSDKLAITHGDPALELAAKQQKAGDLARLRQQLQPAIQQLKAAVCAPGRACTFFDQPWSIRQTRSGGSYVYGLSAMASMVETLRLGYSENLPFDQLAWGHITSAAQITALLPLLTANYDLSNDLLYLAQRRGSILLNALLESIADDDSPTRWFILVAHDTNIAMVRTLMGFSWQLPGYARGNIPPGSSLVLERWRDTRSGERFLRLYFQAQSLDAIRQLQPVDEQHPLLRQEWHQPDCRVTEVGLLCPYQSTLNQLRKHLDNRATLPVSVILP